MFVDEAEDVLSAERRRLLLRADGFFAGDGRTGSRVLPPSVARRKSQLPTIWATNRTDALDEAVLRRDEFRHRDAQAPRRGSASGSGCGNSRRTTSSATEEDARTLAREFDISPGLADGAVRSAALCGGGIDAVRRGRPRSYPFGAGSDASPGGAPALRSGTQPGRRELEGARRRPRLHGETSVSRCCLTGPPGAGKSAWVRYLAERLDLEVLHKRTSDLLDKYVGESEKRIAARLSAGGGRKGNSSSSTRPTSLLRDRRGAVRSWEVSQVNEMLTWMESHPLPFACTTNFAEALDPASLRRFVFKVKLGYLTPDQSNEAFRLFFGLEPPAELSAMRILTPGDFAVVRRKAEILGRLGDASALAAMLREECDAKTGTKWQLGVSGPIFVRK